MNAQPDSTLDTEDSIDAWHSSNSTDPLHVWLGWTQQQYKAWLERGETFPIQIVDGLIYDSEFDTYFDPSDPGDRPDATW